MIAPAWPAYLALPLAELRRRAAVAIGELASCTACPRNCRVNRLENKTAACRSGRYARVASYFPHRGEEDCLRGWRGLGTMLELQGQGCHNINLVTPEHVVPQILEALPFAVERGLRLPIVYNTGAYDALESLQLLGGIVDIYMPDFKFWDRDLSLKYLRARDYPEVARAAIREMHRQVGDLVIGGDGLARRGLLVRHLVTPGGIAGTREIMRFLAEEISKDTYVNVMDQYYPAGRVSRERFFEINRRITRAEYDEAVRAALEAGLHRLAQPRRLAPVT